MREDANVPCIAAVFVLICALAAGVAAAADDEVDVEASGRAQVQAARQASNVGSFEMHLRLFGAQGVGRLVYRFNATEDTS